MKDMRNIFDDGKNLNSTEDFNYDSFFQEMNDVCSQIACTEMWFEMEDDPDLIDSIIYKRESLIARYRYLIKLAKHYKVTSPSYLQIS